MTSCPRCGAVADDEVVCAACGMSLALTRRRPQPAPALTDALGFVEEDGQEPEPAHDLRVWRVAAVLCAGCVVVATLAIVLLQSGGGSGHRPETVAQPPSPSGAFEPTTTPSPRADATTSARAGVSTTASRPRRSPATTAAKTRSPHRRSSAPSSAAPRTSAVAASRSVHVTKGAAAGQCGPHCFRLVVDLSAFPNGAHEVACWAGHGGVFGTYTTSASTSTACDYRHPHDTVWAIVDGRYRSNTIAW